MAIPNFVIRPKHVAGGPADAPPLHTPARATAKPICTALAAQCIVADVNNVISHEGIRRRIHVDA
jgi:hypothetical protein